MANQALLASLIQPFALAIQARIVPMNITTITPDIFVAKRESETEEVFRHRLPIYGVAPASACVSIVASAEQEGCETAGCMSIRGAGETTMSDERTRNLVFRFWGLTSSERREIAADLGLLENEEIRLPEPERYGRALVRAGERRLLERVADEIEKKEAY